MQLITIAETESTNKYITEIANSHEAPFAVMAVSQTAGHGQRGNKWEAFPGMNITLSMLFRPTEVKPSEQFVLSQAVSVAIVETLRHYLISVSRDITIKWPNDIYVGNRKICGILIENALNGNKIVRSVIGVGLNVNQRIFLSDAPNPVSMIHFTGRKLEIEPLARYLCDVIERFVTVFSVAHRYPRLRGRYFSMLRNASGYHPYKDTATEEVFKARISNIAPSGHITLTDTEGRQRVYAFKEVQALD